MEHRWTLARAEGVPEDRQGCPARRGRAPRELRHSFVSSCAHDVRLKDITDLVGHSSTSVTETVYRHEIRPALTDSATAVNRILKANATELACPCSGKPLAPQLAPET